MNTRTLLSIAGALALATSLSACGSMDRQQRATAGGAALGGAAGHVVTGGSTIGTIGGAAAGGVIGNEMGRDR